MGVEISPSLLQSLKLSFKFSWTVQALKYLGTFIPADLFRTFDLNFPPVLQKRTCFSGKVEFGITFLVQEVQYC